jgi:hypothetical protein
MFFVRAVLRTIYLYSSLISHTYIKTPYNKLFYQHRCLRVYEFSVCNFDHYFLCKHVMQSKFKQNCKTNSSQKFNLTICNCSLTNLDCFEIIREPRKHPWPSFHLFVQINLVGCVKFSAESIFFLKQSSLIYWSTRLVKSNTFGLFK